MTVVALCWQGSDESSRVPQRSERQQDLGYVEGRNLEVVRRYADGRVDRLPALADELVQRRVDVIVASGNAAVRAAQAATKTIPIVILIAGQDPSGVQRRQPGRNAHRASNGPPRPSA